MIGWTKERNYQGENFCTDNSGRIYLNSVQFLPEVGSEVVLDLSNSKVSFGKKPDFLPIKQGEANSLLSKADKVLDLILKNPKSRSRDSFNSGYHTAGLILGFDTCTKNLDLRIINLNLASSNINGWMALTEGGLESVFKKVKQKSQIYLVKSGNQRSNPIEALSNSIHGLYK